MCKPASFIVTLVKGDYVAHWSKNSDSHEIIKKEINIKDIHNVRGEPRLIPCEITPPDKDYRLPLKKWVFKSDISPEWADMKKVEAICRKELPKWLKENVVLPNQKVDVTNKYLAAIYGNAIVRGNSTVEAFDNSTVKAWGNSTVEAFGNSTVKAFGNSTVKAWDNSTVEAWGNSTVKAFGNSTVKAFGNSTVKAWGDSTIIAYKSLTPEILKSSKAVMIDRSKDTVICYVGKN
jgi:hypothetical protein